VTSNPKKPSLSWNPSPVRSLTENHSVPLEVRITKDPAGISGATKSAWPSASAPGITPLPDGPLHPEDFRSLGSQQTVPFALKTLIDAPAGAGILTPHSRLAGR